MLPYAYDTTISRMIVGAFTSVSMPGAGVVAAAIYAWGGWRRSSARQGYAFTEPSSNALKLAI